MESDIGDDIKEEEIEDVTVGENSLMCDDCPTELKNEKVIARHKKDHHELIICYVVTVAINFWVGKLYTTMLEVTRWRHVRLAIR